MRQKEKRRRAKQQRQNPYHNPSARLTIWTRGQKFHNRKGPAVVSDDGSYVEYWIRGKQYADEFEFMVEVAATRSNK